MLKQLQFLWGQMRRDPETSVGRSDEDGFTVEFRRNPLARRYRLYIDRLCQPRVTIPQRGNLKEARKFAEQHRLWILSQLEKRRARRAANPPWGEGTPVLFRGEQRPLRIATEECGPVAWLGEERIRLPRLIQPGTPDVRHAVEAHLRRLAEVELPHRLFELAKSFQCEVARVSVRDQRTRWGSCSRRGAVSLNWHLIQLPCFVRDYILIHELMHLREMNHSVRYWKHVEKACPNYREAEAWLKANPGLLSLPA